MTEKQIEALPEPSTWAYWTLARIESEVRMETVKEPNYTWDAIKLAVGTSAPLVLLILGAWFRVS